MQFSYFNNLNFIIHATGSEGEVKAMETSGNALANAIYEAANLEEVKDRLRSLNGRDEEKARQKFANDKYQTRKFFDKDAYQNHAIWSEVYKRADPSQCQAHLKEIESMTLDKRSSPILDVKDTPEPVTANPLVDSTEPTLVDSSGTLDLGYEDDPADQEDLARALAQRAMCSGGAIRRGSFNGGLLSRGGGNNTCRPRRTKSRDASEQKLQRPLSSRSLRCEEEPESESEAESTRNEARRARRRIGRTKSSDLAETGETRLQRRNSNRSLLDTDDTECESEAESIRGDRKCRRRRRHTSASDSIDPADCLLQRRNSRRSLVESGSRDTDPQRVGSKRNLFEKRGSRRSLMQDAQGETPNIQVKRQGSNRALMAKTKTDQTSKMNRQGSNRALMSNVKTDQTSKMNRQGSNRALIKDVQEKAKSRRSSVEDRELHSAIISNSPTQQPSNCSSDEKEEADRKARRRAGRRRTERVNCDSPTSVQHPDNLGFGSGSRSSRTADESSGHRPRRRPSLNGALALTMPAAPTLS